MNPILVRYASVADLPCIWRVEDDSFSQPYPHDLIAKLLRDHPNTFLVVESSPDTIVGYCVAAERGMSAHLISIGVRREYRRRRFGTALIEKLIENLNSSVKELRLEVRQDNAEAITLYKGLGFKYVGTVENYYEDGSNAVKMILNIEGRHISSRNRAK